MLEMYYKEKPFGNKGTGYRDMSIDEVTRNIFHQKIPVPPHEIGREFSELVSHLLKRDPTERLGTGKGDFNEVKRHDFFDGVDWVGLRNHTAKLTYLNKINNTLKDWGITKYIPCLESNRVRINETLSIEERREDETDEIRETKEKYQIFYY